MSLYTALTQVLAPFAARLNGLLTGYDGTVYDTPGEAVRTQINDLHVMIGDTQNQGVPSDVRKAIVKLAKSAIYKPDIYTDGSGNTPYDFTSEFNLLNAWASTKATAITLSQTTLSFASVAPIRLTATITPADTDDVVRWVTSNPAVASVSSNGVVTPTGNGSCTIVASVGDVTASCSVTVSGISAVYSVTNTLVGATNSNSATTANGGASYSGTLSATTGYTMTGATVSVTMGGVDITSTAYSNGTISISEVTGNVVITAEAVEAPLYAFETGSKTFDSGHSIAVANGNEITATLSTTNKDMHCNISTVSTNTEVGNTPNNYVTGTTKLFTIPAGAVVRCVVIPTQITGSSSILAKETNMRLLKYKANATYESTDTLVFVMTQRKYSDLTVNQPVTQETTVEEAVDVYNASLWCGHASGQSLTFKATIKIYVNGIRYI